MFTLNLRLSKINKIFKIISIALLCIYLNQAASAQDKIYIGIKAGGNFSKTTRSQYSFNNPARFGLNPNPEFGILAHLPITDSLSFQPEILYVKKGFQAFEVYNLPNGQTNKQSYDQIENTHIEVPLLLKLAVGRNKVKFFFAVGPAISFLSNSYFNRDSTGSNVIRQKYSVNYKYRQTEPHVDSIKVNGIQEYTTTYYDSITVKAIPEVSAIFASGFHYKLNNSLLIFDIRYAFGLTNPYRYLEDLRPLNFEGGNPPVLQPARHEEFSRRLSFTLSYLISLKR